MPSSKLSIKNIFFLPRKGYWLNYWDLNDFSRTDLRHFHCQGQHLRTRRLKNVLCFLVKSAQNTPGLTSFSEDRRAV